MKRYRISHTFSEMTPEKRPQDPHLDGTGLRFITREHGVEYPDTFPNAITVIDAAARSCNYITIKHDSKVVDSEGFLVEYLDEVEPYYSTR